MTTRPFNFRLAAAILPLACALFTHSSKAADAIWSNLGTVNVPPQIDAVAFENRGTMQFFTDMFFETSNTRFYTNTGNMFALPGWHFATMPANIGVARPAERFMNLNGGMIRAVDPVARIFIGDGGGPVGSPWSVLPSYLWVEADNIVNNNNSRLSVGANGWLRLIGDNINLNRGALEVTAITSIGSGSLNASNYSSDAGIYDTFWGYEIIANPPGTFSSIYSGDVSGALVRTPGVDIQRPGNFPGRTALFIVPTHADSIEVTNFVQFVSITNIIGLTNPPAPGQSLSNQPMWMLTNYVVETLEVPTNITRQAIFVSVSDPSIMNVEFDWHSSSWATNVNLTPQMRMTTIVTNIIEGEIELLELYMFDTLATDPRRVLMRNAASALNYDTFRPTNYTIARGLLLPPGLTGAGWPLDTFLFERGFFSNAVVSMDMSAYGMFINNRPTDPAIHPESTITNLPGRVQVFADQLDLRRTRIRAEGQVLLNTKHLISSSNAIIDSEHLGFFLASTNESVQIVNLAKEYASRLRGDVSMWSGVWQNQAEFRSTNYVITTNVAATIDTNTPGAPLGDTNETINITRVDVTNAVTYNLAATVVDMSGLTATQPVIVWDLVSHADKFTIDDRLNLVKNFMSDATEFTLNGVINFTNGILRSWVGANTFASLTDLVWTNLPNLARFTNNGLLNVPNTIHFGDDRPNPDNPDENLPLSSWVNRGEITTSGFLVDSSYLENSGSIFVAGPMYLTADTAALVGGDSISSQTDFVMGNLRMDNYVLRTRMLNLQVAGNLSDAGVNSSNVITVTRGFNLLNRPTSGSLLGTSFRSILPNFAQIEHTWAADDRGPTAAGFENNLAIGSLIVSTLSDTPFDPLLHFQGTGPGRALYVDFLDLAGLGENVEAWMEIDPSITVYFASARLGFDPPMLPNDIPQTPEEYLDGKFAGRLRWVPSYSGGLSAVAVLVDGATEYMNSGLRNSRTIDSDNDGLPNYFDSTPLGGSTPTPMSRVSLKPSLVKQNLINDSKAFNISWLASPNTVYQIEVATDLAQGNWQPLTQYTNRLSTDQQAFYTDTKSSAMTQRFYRVRVLPNK